MSRRHRYFSLGFLEHTWYLIDGYSFSFLLLPPSSSASMKNLHAHAQTISVSWSDPATRSNSRQHLAMEKKIKNPCENNLSGFFIKNEHSEEQLAVFNTALAPASLVAHLALHPCRQPRQRAPGSLSRGGSSLVTVDIAPVQRCLGPFSTSHLPLGLLLSCSMCTIRCRFHA